MQQPTCIETRVRTVADAHVIFYAVSRGDLPKVTQRLNVDERQAIKAGSVFVWEERDTVAEANGAGITRWTDGRRWGPSRVRDEFLVYYEKLPECETDPVVKQAILNSRLVKQTYSAFVNLPQGRRKWHLVAYDDTGSLDDPSKVNTPTLASHHTRIPYGLFTPARTTKARARSVPRDEQDYEVESSAMFHSSIQVSHNGTSHPPQSVHALQDLEEDPSWADSQGANEESGSEVSSSAVYLPDIRQAQASSVRRGPASPALAPLKYLRNRPYPRRHPIDCRALRSLDSKGLL